MGRTDSLDRVRMRESTSSHIEQSVKSDVGLLPSMAQGPSSNENVTVGDLLEECNIVLGNSSVASDVGVLYYFPDVDATEAELENDDFSDVDLEGDDCIEEALEDNDCLEEGLSSPPNTPPSSPEHNSPLQPSSPDESICEPETAQCVVRSLKRRKRGNTRKPRPRKKGRRKTPKPQICKQCGNPVWSTPGHTQFRGRRYCPHAPGQLPKDQWLKRQRIQAGLAPTPPPIPRTTLWRWKKRRKEKFLVPEDEEETDEKEENTEGDKDEGEGGEKEDKESEKEDKDDEEVEGSWGLGAEV